MGKPHRHDQTFSQRLQHPLLHRTVKQLNDRGYRPTIIAKDGVKGYEIEGADTEYITPNYEENADSDKFLSSKHLWNKKGRTIVLYGDVVFTRKAMDTITDFKGENWTLFCRPRRSLITGTPYGECFAQSFFPHDQKRHEENLHKAAELWRNGEIKRCGGWEHYRLMEGIDPRVHRKRMGKNHIVIDDATEDFDTPKITTFGSKGLKVVIQ